MGNFGCIIVLYSLKAVTKTVVLIAVKVISEPQTVKVRYE